MILHSIALKIMQRITIEIFELPSSLYSLLSWVSWVSAAMKPEMSIKQEREGAASSQKRENYWGGFELQAVLKSSKTQQPKKGIEIEDYYL